MKARGRPRKDAACRTCKIRRVKCDEQKPDCIRCTSTGRKCDGYIVVDTRLAAIELFSNIQELRSFKYFCEKTSLEIASYYDEVEYHLHSHGIASKCSQTFWQSLVPQLSHVNPGLGHLVVALGSMHESIKDSTATFSNPQPSSSRLTFSLTQCNKAISILTNFSTSKPNISIMLASCILIIALQMIQNQQDVALRQFRIGARILRDWGQHTRHMMSISDRYLIDSTLSPILNRFGESLGFTSNDNPGAYARSNTSENDPAEQAPYTLPRVFLTLGAVRSSLHNTLDYIFEDLRHVALNTTAERHEYYSSLWPVLQSWHARFKHFVENLREGVSGQNKRRICLLNIQYLMSGLTFAAYVFKDEMIYDNYLSDFSRIVDLCTQVIEIETGEKFTGSTSSIAFSFDLGILMPLYFTTWRCRDPIIRRRALNILRNCPRREGIFLSWTTSMVAEQVIDIEEDGHDIVSCNEVTISDRIQSMHLHYDPRPTETCDGIIHYKPVLDFTWATGDPCSDKAATVKNKEFHIPTGNDTLGHQPYWVVMPSLADISNWKLLLLRKVFEEPDIVGEYAEISKDFLPVI